MDCPKRETCDCPAARYLRREPENLVVSGYRSVLLGLVQGEMALLEHARKCHLDSLGEHSGRHAIDGLHELVAALGKNAVKPLGYCKIGAAHLCRHECLLLGLVSGLQTGNEDTAWLSACGLAGTRTCDEIIVASSHYAMILKQCAKILLPIPAAAIRNIELRSHGAPAMATLH